MAAIPKPLLIVVVLVILLGVISCAVGAGRGLTDPRPTPGASRSPDPSTTRDFRSLVKPPRVPSTDVRFSGCTNGSDFGGICSLTVTGGLLPRVLSLELIGSLTFTVTQTIQGKERSSGPEGPDANPLEVSIAGTSDVQVSAICAPLQTCRVTVREPA